MDGLGGVDRAIDELATGLGAAVSGKVFTVDVDLIVGTNTIEHTLGRAPTWVQLIPTTASASFAWAWDPEQSGNPRPERLVEIVVAGIPVTARVRLEG